MTMNKEETIETNNVTIRNLTMEEIIPNLVESVFININDDKIELVLPGNMCGIEFKKWKIGRGGLFLKDIYESLKKDKFNNYVLVEEDDKKKIIRLFEDNEYEIYKTRNIIDGKIKDKWFTIIKIVNSDESLTKNNRYIKQMEDLSNKIIVTDHISPSSGDNLNHKENALFD